MADKKTAQKSVLVLLGVLSNVTLHPQLGVSIHKVPLLNGDTHLDITGIEFSNLGLVLVEVRSWTLEGNSGEVFYR